jgi:hypothetical protein
VTIQSSFRSYQVRKTAHAATTAAAAAAAAAAAVLPTEPLQLALQPEHPTVPSPLAASSKPSPTLPEPDQANATSQLEKNMRGFMARITLMKMQQMVCVFGFSCMLGGGGGLLWEVQH